jgi:hypothetical protein
LKTQGVAYGNYTRQQAGVGDAAQLGARQNLAAQKQTLKAARGADRTNYLSQLTQGEEKNVLTAAIANMGNSTRIKTAKISAKGAARRAKLTQKGENLRNKRSTATSRANNAASNATSRANARDRARRAAADARRKNRQAIHKTSVAEHNKLIDIGARWDHYAGMTNPKRGPRGNPVIVNGKTVMVKPTAQVTDAVAPRRLPHAGDPYRDEDQARAAADAP